MNQYFKTISIEKPKASFNEEINKIEYEDVKFSKEVEITKLVRNTWIALISYIIITSILIISSWLIFAFVKFEDSICLPVSIIVMAPWILLYLIGNYINAKDGYIDTSSIFKYEEELFIEELKNLYNQNRLEEQKAKEWRENHPLEEKCRQLMEFGNPNILAEFIKTAAEINYKRVDKNES